MRKEPVPNRWIIALKVIVHVICLGIAARLAWGVTTGAAFLGADPVSYVTHATGFAALRVLVISLAITPVRRLLPKLAWLIRFRRLLGLYAFFFATLHLAVYVVLFAGFSWPLVVDDLKKRPYIWAGVLSWALLVPLAATSGTWAIRRLGKRWQLLHRIVYLAASAGVVHYWWIVKTGVRTPLSITIILGLLLVARPVLTRLQTARRKPVVAPAAAS